MRLLRSYAKHDIESISYYPDGEPGKNAWAVSALCAGFRVQAVRVHIYIYIICKPAILRYRLYEGVQDLLHSHWGLGSF